MTRIAVSVEASRARVELRSSQLTPRLLSTDSAGARVALVATEALLLGGDHVEIEVEVGERSWLEIVEIAGTVAYDAAGMAAGWSVHARVGRGGLLLWSGEPFVVAQGANVDRRAVIELADGAVAALRETLVLGRSAESAGSLRSRFTATQAGMSLLVEDLDLRQPGQRRPGILGRMRVIDTVTQVGHRAAPTPQIDPGCRFELHGPGTVARFVAESLAGSPAAGWWRNWSIAARARHQKQGPAAEGAVTAVTATGPI